MIIYNNMCARHVGTCFLCHDARKLYAQNWKNVQFFIDFVKKVEKIGPF